MCDSVVSRTPRPSVRSLLRHVHFVQAFQSLLTWHQCSEGFSKAVQKTCGAKSSPRWGKNIPILLGQQNTGSRSSKDGVRAFEPESFFLVLARPLRACERKKSGDPNSIFSVFFFFYRARQVFNTSVSIGALAQTRSSHCYREIGSSFAQMQNMQLLHIGILIIIQMHILWGNKKKSAWTCALYSRTTVKNKLWGIYVPKSRSD